MIEVYNFEGDGFEFYDDELIKAYQDDKCCKKTCPVGSGIS